MADEPITEARLYEEHAAPDYLPYAGYAYSGRPGILTAVAIIGIIFASIGLLTGFGYILFARAVSVLAAPANTTIHTTNINALPVTTPITTPPSISRVAPQIKDYDQYSGYSLSRRLIAEGALINAHPLAAIRRQNLDALLADAGQQIFSIPADEMTPKRISQAITGSHTNADEDVFGLAEGELHLNDHAATFYPLARGSAVSYENGIFTDSSGARLASITVGAVVERAHSLSGRAMNAGQIATLTTQLLAPDQKLIIPASPDKAAQQVRSVLANPDGSLMVTINSNQTFLYNANGITRFPFKRPRISKTVAGAFMLESVFSLLVAALLLTTSILILRNNLFAWKLGMFYCIAKLILAAIATIVIIQIMSGMMSMGPAVPQPGVVVLQGMLFGGIGAIFPFFLLIVLLLPHVRAYYSADAVARIY